MSGFFHKRSPLGLFFSLWAVCGQFTKKTLEIFLTMSKYQNPFAAGVAPFWFFLGRVSGRLKRTKEQKNLEDLVPFTIGIAPVVAQTLGNTKRIGIERLGAESNIPCF